MAELGDFSVRGEARVEGEAEKLGEKGSITSSRQLWCM